MPHQDMNEPLFNVFESLPSLLQEQIMGELKKSCMQSICNTWTMSIRKIWTSGKWFHLFSSFDHKREYLQVIFPVKTKMLLNSASSGFGPLKCFMQYSNNIQIKLAMSANFSCLFVEVCMMRLSETSCRLYTNHSDLF